MQALYQLTTTLHGLSGFLPKQISSFFKVQVLSTFCCRAFLTYETDKIRGKGLIRLKEENGKFKRAYTFFTVGKMD